MFMYEDDPIEDLVPGSKKNKHRELLKRLAEVDPEMGDYNPSNSGTFLMSSKTNKKDDSSVYNEKEADQWFNELATSSDLKHMKASKKSSSDYMDDDFEFFGKKKKKKKKEKKKKDGPTDFNKEFAPEVALYHNILRQQSSFTDSLQREYDKIANTKSSARGVTKFTNDLIENINSARNLLMNLVDKNVNVKKLITELSLKERKELGLGDENGSNMADFAASYLKQMIDNRKAINGNFDPSDVGDYTDDEIFSTIAEGLGDETRDEDIDRYLKYENQNITVYAVVSEEDSSDYYYVAKNDNGDIIDDYPLPMKTSISINRSINVATDVYGKKYNIIWN